MPFPIVSARGLARLSPGLTLAAAGVAIGLAVNHRWPPISALTVCVLLGVIVGNCGLDLTRFRPGLSFAAKKLLRLGIVLLGLRLAIGDLTRLGWPLLLAIAAIVGLTFVGTQWIGRLSGLDKRTGLLLATGFSICGASAIAAMNGVLRSPAGAADSSAEQEAEQAVVTAVAMVTLFGSLAIVVLPALQGPLGLDDHRFGLWVGASVHDVAQTVAAASVASSTALAAAVVVKLTRVVLLAPMVTIVSLAQRRRSSAGNRPPLVPLFVLGFLAMVAIRSTGVLNEQVLAAAKTAETVLLAAALFGLGAGVHLRNLVRTGGRAAFAGLISWVLIAGLAYLAVRIIG